MGALGAITHPAADPKSFLFEQGKLEASQTGKQAPAHINKAW